MTTDLDGLLAGRAHDLEDTVVRAPGDSAGAGYDEQTDDVGDDLIQDDLLLAPARPSRLTIALVGLLILVIGVLLGVEVQQIFGEPAIGASAQATTSSASVASSTSGN